MKMGNHEINENLNGWMENLLMLVENEKRKEIKEKKGKKVKREILK